MDIVWSGISGCLVDSLLLYLSLFPLLRGHPPSRQGFGTNSRMHRNGEPRIFGKAIGQVGIGNIRITMHGFKARPVEEAFNSPRQVIVQQQVWPPHFGQMPVVNLLSG